VVDVELPVVTKRSLTAECRSGIPGYDPWRDADESMRFDAGAALAAVEFFHHRLKHVKGKLYGQPFILEPWQRAIVGNLFGWKRADGTRRYRRTFVFVPRKNGKTPLAAGLVCWLLFQDGEHGAEIYGAASTHQQACLVWEWVRGYVAFDPEWRELAWTYKGKGSEAVQRSDDYSTYKVVTSDAFSAHGWNTHGGICDELHTWDSGDLLDAMLTSTAARSQPLIVEITTSDYDRESVCNQEHDYAGKVRDGLITDPYYLPVIWEADRQDDWTSPKTWYKANPNLGVSVSEEYMAAECKRARDVPAYENTFKRLHLNIRTEQDVRAVPMELWDACGGKVDESELSGRLCVGGLDLASRNDVAAWVLLFPPTDEDECWRVLPRFFIPKENAKERERKDGVPYIVWGRQGYVHLTDGNVIDYEYIRAQIEEDGARYGIQSIAGDMWNLEYLRQKLGEIGAIIHGHGQGYRDMSEPTKELLEKILPSGKLAHGGNPVLRWMASNVATSQDPAGNLKPNKKKSSEKIDGIVALIMAIGRWMAEPLEQSSVYETRGLEVI
jgi:phage terminase large subunit-like protein